MEAIAKKGRQFFKWKRVTPSVAAPGDTNTSDAREWTWCHWCDSETVMGIAKLDREEMRIDNCDKIPALIHSSCVICIGILSTTFQIEIQSRVTIQTLLLC